ncbi:superoxide dismutase family protein [Sinomicrobium weinanense]|uniref:Superoxide dismutase [Cu-Zn] n=1 Tax=Sinomicrobium weinanense TaxID=2842200 RepID=A0A926JV72_9FLAO|nr:superoxide dismutase family protein [Sinomicrobium weinanense]MBC9798178.1 superoxide dismutase family protein [Sinomicrobium weinanense]MBU3122142.1 superoxide dismutase family protein [Sinomicrobium weinanense]
MKKISLFTLSVLLLSVSCKNTTKKEKETITEEEPAPTTEVQAEPAKELTVQMEPKSESNVKGMAVFKEEDGTVTMTATFEGLEPGEHAIHLHEKADCSAPDGTSTGGHWNPTFQKHGKWGDSEGYHKGDIGNFTADEEGNGSITFSTDEWCIDCDDETKNIIGKGVIVHQAPDDFVTQPTGDAGSRVSCGGVIQ